MVSGILTDRVRGFGENCKEGPISIYKTGSIIKIKEEVPQLFYAYSKKNIKRGNVFITYGDFCLTYYYEQNSKESSLLEIINNEPDPSTKKTFKTQWELLHFLKKKIQELKLKPFW